MSGFQLLSVTDRLRMDFKQKQPRITEAELVTSLTLHDEETFGSNRLWRLIPARLSREPAKWLVGTAVERGERCCVTHGEKSVWSRLSTQICSPGWWFTFSKLISISGNFSFFFFFCPFLVFVRFSCLLWWNELRIPLMNPANLPTFAQTMLPPSSEPHLQPSNSQHNKIYAIRHISEGNADGVAELSNLSHQAQDFKPEDQTELSILRLLLATVLTSIETKWQQYMLSSHCEWAY